MAGIEAQGSLRQRLIKNYQETYFTGKEPDWQLTNAQVAGRELARFKTSETVHVRPGATQRKREVVEWMRAAEQENQQRI